MHNPTQAGSETGHLAGRAVVRVRGGGDLPPAGYLQQPPAGGRGQRYAGAGPH